MLLILGSMAAGITLDRFAAPPMMATLAAAMLALVGWQVARRCGRNSWANGSLLLAVLMLGAAWHHDYWHMFAANDIGFAASNEAQSAVIEAVVVRGPRRVPAPPTDPLRPMQVGERSRLELRVLAVRDGTSWRAASGNLFATVEGNVIGILPGDHVRMVGMLFAPSSARNPGDFDYAEYCRCQRVLALFYCHSPQSVELVAQGSNWNLRRGIERIRTVGYRALERSLSSRQAGLAAAMFLGVREELDPDMREAFRETGTVHLLVISGLNVGILAVCIMWIARVSMLSDRAELALLAGVTLAYATLTGAQPPVMRATALVLVYCGARLMGRQALAYNAWAAAAVIILIINPSELFQAGTQLSFLAVAALVGVGQSWIARQDTTAVESPWLASLPLRFRMLYQLGKYWMALVMVSFAVWLIVQPLVASRFLLFTPSSIVVGPLVSIPVTVAMASGFAVMTVGVLVPPVGYVFGMVCDRALALVIAIVDIAHATPGSYLVTGGPPIWWLLVFYGLLAGYAFVPVVRQIRWRWQLPVMLMWLALGVGSAMWPLVDRQALRATFLSVGHGVAVVLEFSDGSTWLYDAGSMQGPEIAARSVMGYLATRHIRRIDRLIISHADIDHYNGVPRLAKWFAVGEVNYGPRTFVEDSEPLQILHEALAVTQARQQVIVADERLVSPSQCRVQVLAPPAEGVDGSDNANSVVLLIEYGGQRILLTGDLESPGLELLMARQLEPITVMLVPHHGSARSDPPGLASWANAQHVVISGSMADRKKSVRADYIASGSQVHHTAETGAVEVTMRSNGTTQIRNYLPGRQ
jgi:competence protein ComEC